jgi:3-dehydroquinate synthase
MKLTMQTNTANYDIILERGCIHQIASYMNLDRKVFILTDQNVPDQWAQIVHEQCPNSMIYRVPGGEDSKSMRTFEDVLTACLDFHMSRKDLIIALGGGVIGDLAGFVAASYMRGIDYMSIPTTTLSQIDSSIGGKTAINLGKVKNIVGAFYHPKLVLIDFDTLSTLPERQKINGLAEAIKAGLIWDPELFALFEQDDYNEHLEEIIYRSLCMKREIVQQDEKEGGLRKLLNFGHTIGHGIETYFNLETYLHGESVAMGMFYFITSEETKERLKKICLRLGLPVTADFDIQKVYEITSMDKKASGNMISTVWVDTPGKSYIKDLPIEELLPILNSHHNA